MNTPMSIALAAATFAGGLGLGWMLFGTNPPAEAPASDAAETAPEATRPPGTHAAPIRPKTTDGGPGVELVYSGDTYRPPKPVQRLPVKDWKTTWDTSTPESSYAGVLASNQTGEFGAVLETFAPPDRAGVRAKADPQALQRNQAFFAAVTRESICDRVDYGEYAILVIKSELKDGSVIMRDAPFVKTPDGWLLTNALHDDVFFTHLIEGIKEACRDSSP